MPKLSEIARVSPDAPSPGDQPKLVNLTGHIVTLLSGEQVKTIIPDGMVVPRLHFEGRPQVPFTLTDDEGKPMRMPRRKITPGQLAHLPDPVDGVFYLVSRIVAANATGRTDLLVPDGLLKDSRGGIIGCTFLSQVTG